METEKRRSIAGFVVDGIVILIALVINLYLLAYLGCWDCHPLLIQVNGIAHWLTLMGVLVFFGSIVVRSPRYVWAWAAPGALAFLFWYGPNFIPLPKPDPQGIELKVATFNVAKDGGDVEKKFAVIQALDVDILALHEVEPVLKYMVSTRLQARYPYQYEFPLSYERYDEFALLSKYPLTEYPEDIADYAQNSPRIHSERFIRATVDVDGYPIAVYVFHPVRPPFTLGRTYDDSRLKTNLRLLMTAIRQESNPVLVLCDCNFSPRSRQYAQLNTLLDDAFGKRGWGLGLTSPGVHSLNFPNVRIDYIWYSGAFTAVSAEVGEDAGTSDHLPVLATLVLETPTQE